jgi:hypothetical protein
LFKHGPFGAIVGDGGEVGKAVGDKVGGVGAAVGAMVGALVGAFVHCAPKLGQSPEKGSHV